MNSIYAKYIKRLLDIVLSLTILICFFWLYIIVGVLVLFNLGNPIIFSQTRPGLINKTSEKEKLFKLYKFRSMSNETDEKGDLKSDECRLTRFGQKLRATSLDELPELFNILKGDMSFVGPRPQLVRDMVFMTEEQRKRHIVKPGLTGLAQINGRNCLLWEDKFKYDLQYIDNISFIEDVKIFFITFIKVFKTESITFEGMATSEDYGDYLLRTNRIDKEEYNKKQEEAIVLLNEVN